MRAASQLPGRGPTVMDMIWPLYLHVNQKRHDDDDDDDDEHGYVHKVSSEYQ